jgi:MarR family transcriptional regulator, organic hydroperoxide resistance regulator
MHRSEELRYLILAAQREGNRMLAQALRPLAVTPSQAEALSLLRTRQPLSLSGLGDLLVCESGSSPSRLIDRLVAAGLVERQVDDGDRRHIRLSLTPEGARVADEIAAIENELHATLDAMSAGHNVDEATALLWTLVGDLPAGRALSRRKNDG